MKAEDPDLTSKLEEIVAEYLHETQRGLAPDPESFVRRHPGIEEPLRARFAALNRLDECFGRLRREAPAEDDAPPPNIPDFHVLDRLGRGGMGVVYLAEQLSLKRLVALKVLSPFWTSDPRAVERFKREAETIARLSHPGIVAIHQFGNEGGTLYLSIDFVPGMDLAALITRLRESKLPPSGADILSLIRKNARRSEALAAEHGTRILAPRVDAEFWEKPFPEICASVVKRTAEALEFAHSNRVLHRDIKPSNIILGVDGRPRIIDFGLTVSDTSLSLTRPSDFIGSAPYCSPEQIAGGTERLSAASEVFSLGTVLYELSSLTRPFDGKTLPEIFSKVAKARPAELRSIAPWVPPRLENVCHAALERDARRRYPTAGALAEDLGRYLSGKPVRARSSWRKHALRSALVATALLVLGFAVRRALPPIAVPEPPAVLKPTPPAPPPVRPARKFPTKNRGDRDRGLELLRLRRFVEAASLLGKAVEASPADAGLRADFAEALGLSGDLKAAGKQYALCATLAPKDARIRQGYASVLARGGDLSAAVREYKNSLSVSSNDARTHLLIAELLVSLRRDEEAVYYYTRAVKLASTAEDLEAAKKGLEIMTRGR